MNWYRNSRLVTIGVIKRIFGFAKVRYRGIAKNAHRLFVACALANLFMVPRDLGLFWRSARTDARIKKLCAEKGARAAFEAAYDDLGDPWASGAAEYCYQRHKYDTLIALLPQRRYAWALDLGCGLGLLSQRLATRAEQVLGLDISESALVQARRTAAHLPNLRFKQADVLALNPELAGQFDLVVVADMLYYLNPLSDELLARLAAQIGGLLKPGGLCMLANHYFFFGDPASLLSRRIHRSFADSAELQLDAEYSRPFYLVSLLTRRALSASAAAED